MRRGSTRLAVVLLLAGAVAPARPIGQAAGVYDAAGGRSPSCATFPI